MVSLAAPCCKLQTKWKNNFYEFMATLTEVEWTKAISSLYHSEKMQLPRYNVEVQRWRMTQIVGIVL